MYLMAMIVSDLLFYRMGSTTCADDIFLFDFSLYQTAKYKKKQFPTKLKKKQNGGRMLIAQEEEANVFLFSLFLIE
jgi:hypothetical protein